MLYQFKFALDIIAFDMILLLLETKEVIKIKGGKI
jgi:hypothetical protein